VAADPAPGPDPLDRAPVAEQREHPGCVVGIAFGLLVTFGTLAVLCVIAALRFFGGELDGEERAADWFEGGVAPLGFEVVDAERLPLGETLVHLARPGVEPAAGEPDELVLMDLPDYDRVEQHFEEKQQRRGGRSEDEGKDDRLARWEEEPDFAWFTARVTGDIDWGGWRARYKIVRSFHEGGGWRESARVDLSVKDHARLLFVQWPVGVEGTDAALRQVLRDVRMTF
jgi:hypothetical protein